MGGLEPELTKWGDLEPELPKWGDLEPELPKWGDLELDLTKWVDLEPEPPRGVSGSATLQSLSEKYHYSYLIVIIG